MKKLVEAVRIYNFIFADFFLLRIFFLSTISTDINKYLLPGRSI